MRNFGVLFCVILLCASTVFAQSAVKVELEHAVYLAGELIPKRDAVDRNTESDRRVREKEIRFEVDKLLHKLELLREHIEQEAKSHINDGTFYFYSSNITALDQNFLARPQLVEYCGSIVIFP